MTKWRKRKREKSNEKLRRRTKEEDP